MKRTSGAGRGGPGSHFAAFGLFGSATYLVAAGIGLLYLSRDAGCRGFVDAPFAASTTRCLADGWHWFLNGLVYGIGGVLVIEPPLLASLVVSGLLAFLIAGLLGLFRRWRGLLLYLVVQLALTGLWGALSYLRFYIR